MTQTKPPPEPGPESPRHYRWPWLVLAAVVLGIVLAILWVSREVERTRQYRQNNPPTAGPQ